MSRGTVARDLSGLRFGRLVVLSREGSHVCPGGTIIPMFRVQCDCGAVRLVAGRSLRRGDTRSCGCLNSESRAARSTEHGKAGTPIYRVWKNMIARCGNPSASCYANYGGRGIRVCEPWRASFAAFYRDVGDPPSRSHTLDRIDSNGHYEPTNVRWATRAEQNRNRRSNILVTIEGRTQPVIDWAHERGLNPYTVYKRIKKLGWSPVRALTEGRRS